MENPNIENIEKQDTAKRYCRKLLDIMTRKGVKEMVLSPGSRNAPLLIGAECRENLKAHIVLDERTAAFIALGRGIQSGLPVALGCTSGTALYNYAPAIAEALYQSIPLIVITADRPKEWIDQDDSQTLRQFEALEKIVKASYDIPAESVSESNTDWYVNRIINEAMNTALNNRRGPVHINIQFDNPLSSTVDQQVDSERIVEIVDDSDLSQKTYLSLAKELYGKRILITAGFMQPNDDLQKSLTRFCQKKNVKILCETISNLHLSPDSYAIDTVLAPLEDNSAPLIEKELRPDVVISIGGALVSRKLKEFIRKAPDCECWTLGDTAPGVDCFQKLTKHIEVSPAKFFKGLSKAFYRYSRENSCGIEPSYKESWKRAFLKTQRLQKAFLMESGWSELTAFQKILSQIPSSSNVFLSNGTAVRYAQLFTDKIHHAYYANRGVSGIEGTSATALGCSMGFNKDTYLISGDMSFAYSPEILGYNSLTDRLKIILINNEGGGIFRFVPSTRDVAQREKLFCSRPLLPTEGICKEYGWEYLHASTESDFNRYMKKFVSHNGNILLELSFVPQASADALLNFMNIKLKDQ